MMISSKVPMDGRSSEFTEAAMHCMHTAEYIHQETIPCT
jgi:hypothetical protein